MSWQKIKFSAERNQSRDPGQQWMPKLAFTLKISAKPWSFWACAVNQGPNQDGLNPSEDPSHNVGTPEDHTFRAHTDEREINPTLQKAETRVSFLWVLVPSRHPKPVLTWLAVRIPASGSVWKASNRGGLGWQSQLQPWSQRIPTAAEKSAAPRQNPQSTQIHRERARPCSSWKRRAFTPRLLSSGSQEILHRCNEAFYLIEFYRDFVL